MSPNGGEQKRAREKSPTGLGEKKQEKNQAAMF
jgi:hypothetical protein